MLTDRQEQAMRRLPALQADYYSACALLEGALKPTQRLTRQSLVRIRLAAVNAVREIVGLAPLAGPRLLSVDELLAPAATPAALHAAFDAANKQPGLGWIVARIEDGSTALAA